MEPEIVDYTPHCERRQNDGEYEHDPLKPDEASYTPLLEPRWIKDPVRFVEGD